MKDGLLAGRGQSFVCLAGIIVFVVSKVSIVSIVSIVFIVSIVSIASLLFYIIHTCTHPYIGVIG